MKPFTKLFSSIVTSSIWRESTETKVVWITMLALADKNGEVWASVGGLAHTSGVDRSACEKSLQVLLSPDPDSRSKEYDGRRLEAIDGGWRILNYKKYREIGRGEDRREYFAEKKREYRAECPQMSTPVHTRPQMSPIAEAEAEADTEREGESKKPPPPTNISNRKRLAKTLRLLGLHASESKDGSPGSITEWAELMVGRGECSKPEDVLDGICWIVSIAKSRGIKLEYARHAAALADEWAIRIRNRKPKPKEQGYEDSFPEDTTNGPSAGE